MNLESLRQEIDKIDSQIIPLFCQRMEIAAQIGQYKKERGLPVLVPQRETQKLQEVASLASAGMGDYTQELFRALFALSRDYQARLGEKQLQCGLLGQKLGHSYSPQIHRCFAGYRYDLMETEPQELGSFLEKGSFHGLNVTIPYKKAVVPYCHELSPQAAKLGSVNTLLRRPDGTLYGDNTDYYGFQEMLSHSGLDVKGKKVLVLGTGGASVTVQAVLASVGAQVVVISRQGENNYTNLSRHRDARILVNATPVGMYPNNGQSPLDLAHFPQLEGVLDLVYNPARTALVQQAHKRGIVGENGLYMLVAQAKRAAEIFTGRTFTQEQIQSVYTQLSRQMENILLIGMPGCGKSSIAAILGRMLGRKVVDSDEEILRIAGKPIPDIFATQGEDAFRALETQALRSLSKASGVIIATGGGCVTREENWDLLKQNSIVYWIKRDLQQLPIQGRPLSQDKGVEELYKERQPLYSHLADHVIENSSTPEAAAREIAAVHAGG